MRRRALLGATATALAPPLLAGCARDDGGDGGGDGEDGDENRGAGGMYGVIGAGETLSAGESADDAGSEPDSRRAAGPAFGPEDTADDD